MIVCAFTGHRPEKLPFSDEQHPDCIRLKKQLYQLCVDMLTRGVTVFLSGMSRGVDTWAAECVLRLQTEHPDLAIQLWAAIPYAQQAKGWPAADQERYQLILSAASQVFYLSDSYYRGFLHRRNRFMVEHSRYLIAVYNNSSGGTESTIQYAEKKGLEIFTIQP